MATRRERAEQALQNPGVLMLLDLIADAEGVQHGYATGFGNTVLENLKDHPRQLKEFKQTDGKTNKTSAAGRYQFLSKTWDDVAGKLGLSDFGEVSQDLAAVELIRRRGALEDAERGDIKTAISKLGQEWASLPASPYAQPTRSDEWIANWVANNAGSQSGEQPSTVPGSPVDIGAMLAQSGLAGERASSPPGMVMDANRVPPMQVAEGSSQLTPTGQAPDWAAQLAAMTAPQPQQLDEGSQSYDETVNRLLALAIEGDAADARNAAVAGFFGEEPLPQIKLPNAIERTINKLLSESV